jgi:hypothetical protein
MPTLFSRTTRRFYCNGIDLNNPLDSVREGYFPVVENVRQYSSGVLQPRVGLTSIANVVAGQTPVHTVRRLNDPNNSTYTRIVGTGTALAYGQTSFTQATYNSSNVLFSGNPLTIVPYRPDQSPDSWAYIADSLAQYKIKRDGTVHQIGLPPPTAGPTIELGVPKGGWYNIAWVLDGTVATTLLGPFRVNGGSVTVTRYVFDSSNGPGWCSVVPTSLTSIGPGMIISAGDLVINTEYVRVAEVYPGATTNSIAGLLYVTGTTGSCIVQPTTSQKEFRRNAVVKFTSASAAYTAFYARITAVIDGLDDSIAFKCDTGSVAVVSGDTIQVVPSFRAYFNGSVGTTLFTGDKLQEICSQGTFKPTGGNQTGYFQKTGLTLDLTKMPTPVGSTVSTQQFTDDDYLHLSFFIDDLSKVSQCRIMFDCGSGDFKENYFYRAFTSSDLVAAAKGIQTTIDGKAIRTQRRIIDHTPGELFQQDVSVGDNNGFDGTGVGFSPAGSSSGFSDQPSEDDPTGDVGTVRSETGTGDNQWSEILFKRGDCTRVGTDYSYGWSAVNAVRVEVTMTSDATAALGYGVRIDSLTGWGGYNPDISKQGSPYQYRYRYRCSTTGARSVYSPATQSGVLALRHKVTVTCASSALPEVDFIDVERFGGSTDAWNLVGSVANSSPIFTDLLDDAGANDNAPFSEGDTNYQPWIVIDTPKSGTTVANGVVGTFVKDSGTNFNTQWAKGTSIKVNGLYTTIRRVYSTSLLEVMDALGALSSVRWEITEPRVQSQPLPSLWGPWRGRLFACGDNRNPGTLYWSAGNNPDSTREEYRLEITAPSDPLIAGCVYNDKNYVFSSDKMFEITELGPGLYAINEVPNGRGLYSRWALAVGDRIYYLGKDGIYVTAGGESLSITDATLFPLFPNEGNLGTAVNTFNPPNMVTGQDAYFRLNYYDNYLYFVYKDTTTAYRSMVYMTNAQNPGWFMDRYTPGVTYHYGEEGSAVHSILACGSDVTTGKLYTMVGTNDAGTAITWAIQTPAFDADDRRADKNWGDFIVDADTNNTSISIAASINNASTGVVLSSSTMNTLLAGRSQKVFDIVSGAGTQGKNFSVLFSGNLTTGAPKLYLWEPSYAPRPEDTFLRATEFDDDGYLGAKFMQGVLIEADTGGAVRTVQIQGDGGVLGDTLTINHNGRIEKPYSFSSAFISHQVRFAPTDNASWKLFKWRWIWTPEPPLVLRYETQQTNFGLSGYMHLRDCYVELLSTATVTLTITRAEDGTAWTYTIPSTAGRRKKNYVILDPIKGKGFLFTLTSSAGFRLYKDACEIRVKPWGSEEQYSVHREFGHTHGPGVAEI